MTASNPASYNPNADRCGCSATTAAFYCDQDTPDDLAGAYSQAAAAHLTPARYDPARSAWAYAASVAAHDLRPVLLADVPIVPEAADAFLSQWAHILIAFDPDAAADLDLNFDAFPLPTSADADALLAAGYALLDESSACAARTPPETTSPAISAAIHEERFTVPLFYGALTVEAAYRVTRHAAAGTQPGDGWTDAETLYADAFTACLRDMIIDPCCSDHAIEHLAAVALSCVLRSSQTSVNLDPLLSADPPQVQTLVNAARAAAERCTAQPGNQLATQQTIWHLAGTWHSLLTATPTAPDADILDELVTLLAPAVLAVHRLTIAIDA